MKEKEQSINLVIKEKVWMVKETKNCTIFREELEILKDINSQLHKKFKIIEKAKKIKIKVPKGMYLDCKSGRITHIGFSKCNLSPFPLSICNLKLLQKLFLEDCNLTKLPDAIGHLYSLET